MIIRSKKHRLVFKLRAALEEAHPKIPAGILTHKKAAQMICARCHERGGPKAHQSSCKNADQLCGAYFTRLWPNPSASQFSTSEIAQIEKEWNMIRGFETELHKIDENPYHTVSFLKIVIA